MSKWNIYHKDGSFVTDVNDEKVTVKELEYSGSWMGECFVTIDFNHPSPIKLEIGDYIMYRGERFELNYDPGKDKQARKDTYGDGFKYDSVKFSALQDEMQRSEFLDVVLHDNQLHYTALPKFSFYVETVDDLLDRIQANLDEQIGDGKWKIFSRSLSRSMQRGCSEEEWKAVYGSEETSTGDFDSKSLVVDSKTCWEALALVNTEWDINFIVRNRNVYVGTAGVMTQNIFKYGMGNGLYEVDQNADPDQSIITRLRAYGSEKNLPDHYYADLGSTPFLNVTGDYKPGSTSNGLSVMLEDSVYDGMFTEVKSDNGSNMKHVIVSCDIDGYRFNAELELVLKQSPTCTTRLLVDNNKPVADAVKAKIDAGFKQVLFVSGAKVSKFNGNRVNYIQNLPNNMAISRLMLPGFPSMSLADFYDSLSESEKSYVNPSGRKHIFSTDKYRPYIDSANLEKIGLRSGSQFFDTDDKTNGVIDIYPTIEEMVIGGVRVDEIYTGSNVDDDGRYDTEAPKNLDIFLSPAIDFDINDLRDNDFTISMKDGMCGGRDFKVASATKIEGVWRLTIERVKDDALNLWFPYKDYQIKKGDHFVLTGIELPDSYIRAASLKLLKYAIALLDKNDYTRYVYQLKVDEIFMARQHDLAMADKTGAIKSLHDTLKEGDIMQFFDEDFGIDAKITIDQLTIKENEDGIPTYEVTLREDKEVGTIQKIQQQISSLSSGNGGSGSGSGLTMGQVTSLIPSEGGKYFLSKLQDDTAQGIITFLKGLKVGDTGNYEITAEGLARMFSFMTSNFNSGLYGQGASIDKDGAAELDSLFVRKFISTPKFVFNEISVTKAEQWNTNGFGTIASVDTTKRQITLKLEENDYGSLSEGDICRGIFADIDNTYDSDSIEDGAVDDCNFVTHKGFFTTYFYVRRIITAEKGKFVFEYGKRSKNTPDPCPYMDFAQYGSFTDKDRMSSMYFCSRGRSYIEVLDGVKTWEVQVENRVARYGYLGNLRVKRKDGTYIDLKGNGLFAQNNVYFGDNIFRLENISNLDELENIAASYDVSLSQYQSVLTVDDMGNVINGLYTQDEGKTTKQYRISTAVFVRKGSKILLEEDENSEEVTEGHYRLSVVSAECSCDVHNSTVFVTAIKNVKDGVLGSEDDDNFDYDEMRKMTDCMITIVVDCEGKTSKLVQMPIRIQHDSLPFMVCDLTNEHAAVSWHTKHKHYAGLPIQTTVNMFYKNEPYDFAMTTLLPADVRDYLVVSISDSGKSKVVTIDKKADFSSDVLPTSFEIGIYCVSDYAGAKYEYTKKLSVSKTSDAVIYEIVPSTNSVKVNSKNEVTPSSVGCEVWATSSDDKRYQVTTLPDGYSLSYQKNGGTLNGMQLGAKIDVAATDKEIAFVLKHTENGVEYIDDKEGVPVVADGKDGLMALCSDNMVSIAVDNNGKVLTALNSTLSFRLFAGAKELTVSGVSISASPTSNVVTATVIGNTLKLACSVGVDFGKSDLSYIIKVDGKDGSVTYSSYVAVKIVPNVMGKSIKAVNTYYALNNSATSQPADSAFTYDTMGDAVIASNADKYLWSGDKITYSDNSTAITGIYLVGKCSELASVTEQYAKTTTADGPTSGWSDTYPSSVVKGDFIWSRDKVTWKNGDVSYSAAQFVGYIGTDGAGQVVAYKRAASIPNYTPSVTDFNTYQSSNDLGSGWTKSAPSSDDSLVSGGSVSGVSANNNTVGGTWSSVTDGGYNWYKSPSVADGGIATMRIYFTTSVANQYVTFYLRAYSENNYDFVLISAIDSTSLTRNSDYTARVSGNGSDTYIRLKCSTAGQHFVTVAYAKDVSGSNNGDYGLVRMATSENYISQSSILYRCDGSVEANIISWGSIYQAQGDKGDKGDQGNQGVGISSITTYYLISSLSSGVSTSTSGWGTSMVNPTSSKPYLWSYTMTTLTDGSEVNSTPVIIGNFAEAGPMGTNGCIARHAIWKTDVEFRNDSALTTDGIKYLDYVYVENSNATYGWDMYVCRTTHTSSSYNSPTGSYSSTYWTKLSDVGPIYTPFLLAKNAVLNFAQSQQLNLMNGNEIWGSIRNPSGQHGDQNKWALWLGGSTASSAPFRVDKDGNAYLNSGLYEGSMRSPFKGIGAGFDNILTDNISTVGVTNVNFVNPKLDYVGRLVHFVNYRWNGSLQSGTSTLKLPSGYYFYEDGVAKSSIQLSRECITLLGLGDDSHFYGWLVLDRVDIETDKKYGHDMKCLAYGKVTGVTSGTPSIRYKTFNGSSNMTATRTGTGIYRISCPSSWFGNDTSNVFVQLTGVGYSLDSSKKTEPIKATLWSVEFSINTMFITVHTSDDETVNDGSFNFMISNFDDFTYLG